MICLKILDIYVGLIFIAWLVIMAIIFNPFKGLMITMSKEVWIYFDIIIGIINIIFGTIYFYICNKDWKHPNKG